MRVGKTSLADDQVCDLLEAHQRNMYEISPPGTSFALDLTGLSGPTISLFGAWEGNTLMAVGALNRLSDTEVEIKSMRTHTDHLGKGAAQAVLNLILDTARTEGIARISLETGTSDDFKPAIKLYLKNGFVTGEAFADYANGPHNQCYHLDLQPEK
uniref:GNAT family N-acetyltransferase n=1 Tax=uncultured Altererythrobacter sp. TaxID=500840 RepID=UPI002630D94D|nr:GNAT family N-acetyltransferase [uncultured Altererythrobacter sp.]